MEGVVFFADTVFLAGVVLCFFVELVTCFEEEEEVFLVLVFLLIQTFAFLVDVRCFLVDDLANFLAVLTSAMIQLQTSSMSSGVRAEIGLLVRGTACQKLQKAAPSAISA